MKLIPSVTRVFHSSSNMYVYLQTYEPDAATAQPLLAYLSFFQGGVNVMETPPAIVVQGLDPKSHMLPLRLSFSLGDLKPGEYDCEVIVKGAFRRAPVMVIP